MNVLLDIVRSAQHINALELYTIVVAVKFWAPKLHLRKFIVSCDNEAAVTVVNSGKSKDPFMKRCLRELWFTAAVYDCELTARHIPGVHNVLADALSRWHADSSYHKIFYAPAASLSIHLEPCLVIVLLFKSRNIVSFVGHAPIFCAIRSFLFSSFSFFLGSPQGLQFLDCFAYRLIRLAHADSIHEKMQSHLRIFTEFCHHLGLRPFPVPVQTILRYIAFLSVTGRSLRYRPKPYF